MTEMMDLTIVTNSADPADLFAAYQSYTARYERLCDDIDLIDRKLRSVSNRKEGQRLAAELGVLTEDSAIALGWVAAAFAAYTFASYGTIDATAAQGLVSLTGRSMAARRPARMGGAR